MLCGSREDLMPRSTERTWGEGPQMLMWRLSLVGHQGSMALAHCLAQRSKIDLAIKIN